MTYDELLEENRFLRRQLALEVEPGRADRLAVAFKLSPFQGTILAAMYARGGDQTLTPAHIEDLSNLGGNAASVHICRMRKKLGGPDTIETVWGRGWRVSPELRARIDALTPVRSTGVIPG